ncbi:MAG: hypothetical protein V4857_13285 [Pseudomonadota bacterium]
MQFPQKWQSLFAAVAMVISMTACNDSGPPPKPETPSEVANEVARAAFSASAGAVLTVPASAAGMQGVRVEIPADAAIDDIEVQVGYEDALPGPFRAEAVAAQATAVSKTLVLKVAKGGPTSFNQVVTVSMPYDVAAAGDLPPAVAYWDPEAKLYRAVSVVGIDRAKGTVTFRTAHFSKFMAFVVKALGLDMPSVDTGFRTGADSVLHPNFGSYAHGGHCAAFASISTHYYSLARSTRLYPFAQEGALEQPVDDEITRTAMAMTYALLVNKWNSVASSLVIPSKTDTGKLMIAQMILTGHPLHLVMHSGNDAGGHSVTAFAYDAPNARFRIYDSNFPKNEVTFDWNALTGFGTYSRAAAYPATMFDNIGYTSDGTFGAPAQFQKIISDWEGGKLKDYFANLEVTDDKGAAKPLIYASAVNVQVPYLDNQSVSGKFSRPAGSTKPVYLHVYYDGKPQTAAAPAIDAAGNFILKFPTKLEKKIDVMLLVSEHPRSTVTGFSSFGKFTVQPEGKNFFLNFGFETGDMTGWTSQTRLLSTGELSEPDKFAAVGVGFDPIATDLPTAVFGKHAALVNDATPGYHATYLTQKATVPAASSNPQLVFQWAAVLEDPQHTMTDQPYVDVVVRNITKGTDLYRRRFFTSDAAFTGWKEYKGGAWKAIPWQPVLLTGLAPYAGDEIELRITGADCALGGHGGYVYLDGEE